MFFLCLPRNYQDPPISRLITVHVRWGSLQIKHFPVPLFCLADPGEEGGLVPKAHDGQASGLRCSIGHLSRHVHRNKRDWNTHGKSISNFLTPASVSESCSR